MNNKVKPGTQVEETVDDDDSTVERPGVVLREEEWYIPDERFTNFGSHLLFQRDIEKIQEKEEDRERDEVKQKRRKTIICFALIFIVIVLVILTPEFISWYRELD